ncbi:MAG: hypothetical protein R3Y53_08040 [Bacillota bacterium]
MALYTKNYKLKKPDYEDYYDIRDINRNMEIIDGVLMELENREETGTGGSGANGKDGADGTDGADGLSAYEVAVKNGFSGSESDWLLSLKGADGQAGDGSGTAYDDSDLQERVSTIESDLDDLATKEFVAEEIGKIEIVGGSGVAGQDGANGKDGVDGVDGADGTDGADGLSAYEVAVKNGFSGSESDWLLSLKGADGTDGTAGDGSGTAYDDSDLQERVGTIESDYVTASAVAEVLQEVVDTKADKTMFSDYVKTTDFTTGQATQDEEISNNQTRIVDLETGLTDAENKIDNLEEVVELVQPSDVLTPYDLIITTQEQFEEMYLSEDWLGATRVALVGGRFVRNDGAGLLIPMTVKQLDCLGGAVIVIDEWVRVLDTDNCIRYVEMPADDVSMNISIECYINTVHSTARTATALMYLKNVVIRNAIIGISANAKLDGNYKLSIAYSCKNITVINAEVEAYLTEVSYYGVINSCDTVYAYNIHMVVKGTISTTIGVITMVSVVYNLKHLSVQVTLEVPKVGIALVYNGSVVSNVYFTKLTNNSGGTLTRSLSGGTNTYMTTASMTSNLIGGIS